MWEGKRGLLKVYPHKADGLQGKMDHLNQLVQTFTAAFQPGVKTDKIVIMCGSDESCEQVAGELRKTTNEPIYVFTEEMCRNDDDKVQEGWELSHEGKVRVFVLHSDWYDQIGLNLTNYFIIFDPTSKPKQFQQIINLIIIKKKSFYSQDVNVSVISTDSDSLDFLKILRKEVIYCGNVCPDWLETMISEKTEQRRLEPPPPPKNRKRPRTIYDLEPDEHGNYFCPSYLLRIPKDDEDYSDDDEEYKYVGEEIEETPPQFD